MRTRSNSIKLPKCNGCENGFVVPTLEVFDNSTGKTTLAMPDTPAISPGGDDN